MSKTRLALIVGLLFLLLLIVRAPAGLLGALLPADSVLLSGYGGTLWRGSAARALVATPGGWFHLGRVSWQLKPWSLLLLAPRLQVDANWGRQHMQGEIALVGSKSFTLRGFEAAFDASLVQQLAPLALDGVLTADFERLEIDEGLVVQAAGRLVWERATWLAPRGSQALGSYAMELGMQDGSVSGEVLTLAGPVTANGRIQLAGRRYAVDLALGSEGAMNPQLQQALSLVARPVATGYQLNLEGEL